MTGTDDIEAAARQAVKAVVPRLRDQWSRAKRIGFKGPVDIVTETDREVEDLVTSLLRERFPDHLIIGEEASTGGAPTRPDGERPTWFLDPLDGTVNFAHGVPHFSFSLAFGIGSDLHFAVVADPMRDEVFEARKGGGATLNGAPIRVSGVEDLEAALIATGLPYDRRERLDYYLRFTADFLRRARDVRRFGSAALDLCYVACGRYDGFWEWKLQPWDTAAGALIVREAGGCVSDFVGGPFDLFGDQTLASNGRLHGSMKELLRHRLEKPE